MHKKLAYTLFVLPLLTLTLAGGTNDQFNSKKIDGNLNATDKPDHIVLTWTDDPSTTQTITWRAATSVTEGHVAYNEFGKPESGNMNKQAAVEVFKTVPSDTPGTMNIFSVTLTGLKPGTRYGYTVVCGGNSSRQYYFTTAAKNIEEFEFLVFGDSQGGQTHSPEYSQWHTTVQNAFSLNPNARFMVNMGDLVETGQNYIHWNNWFDACRDVISAIPLVPVEGNHETFGIAAWSNGKPVYYLAQFKLFPNGPDGLKGQAYSFEYGNAHLSILDTQEGEESSDNGNREILKAQADWLANDLKSSRKRWKIVLFHKPPYSHHPFNRTQPIRNIIRPVLDAYHVDLALNGHDHVLARTFPMKNETVQAGPADGTIYYTTGRSGSKSYTMLLFVSNNAFYHNPRQQPCYEKVMINSHMLQITAYNQDGSVIDTFTIKK